MSIFKTEVPEGICCTTDQVVSAAVCTPEMMLRLPGWKKTSEMDTQNTHPGAVRRKGNSNA